MNKVKQIERLTERELENLTPYTASWHYDYKDSAYIYIGGLNYRMNEGDIVIVFSQYGEIVDCRLARDKKTGKSKGFCFLAYEDQRSTMLAVDNLNGIELCGRTIMVDHVKQYRIPREYLETEEEIKKKKKKKPFKSDYQKQMEQELDSEEEGKKDEDEDGEESDDANNPEYEGLDEEEIAKLKWEKRLYKPSGPDGKGWGDFRKLNENDLNILQEFSKAEEKEEKRRLQLDARNQIGSLQQIVPGTQTQTVPSTTAQNPDIIVDEDKRWEMMFRQQLKEQEEEEKRQEKERMKEEIENLRKLIKLKEKAKKEKKSKKDKKSKKKKDKKRKDGRDGDSDDGNKKRDSKKRDKDDRRRGDRD